MPIHRFVALEARTPAQPALLQDAFIWLKAALDHASIAQGSDAAFMLRVLKANHKGAPIAGLAMTGGGSDKQP